VPNGLHGLDRTATWSYSRAEGWVYGHGTFCLATHQTNVLGAFKWMPNSAHEAKRLRDEIGQYERLVKYACMDSKADPTRGPLRCDVQLYRDLKDQYDMQLPTAMRCTKDTTPKRRQMRQELRLERHRRIYRERGHTVEPMQSLVKDIFELDRCWMRGNDNNRWLFATGHSGANGSTRCPSSR
jgi:hypothetical protein